MKMAIKRKNDEFLVITLKHVSGLMGHANPPRTSKLREIAYENGHKTQKNLVFGQALKHVSGVTVIFNRIRTPKVWAITHKNSHNTQKRRFLGHNSQTCKSPCNPKTVGN